MKSGCSAASLWSTDHNDYRKQNKANQNSCNSSGSMLATAGLRTRPYGFNPISRISNFDLLKDLTLFT